MKEATARVMIIKVSVPPDTAAKGATSASTRICFTPSRICAFTSCSATCRAASAAAARMEATPARTTPAAAEVSCSSAALGSEGRLPAAAAPLLLQRGTTVRRRPLMRAALGTAARCCCGREQRSVCIAAVAAVEMLRGRYEHWAMVQAGRGARQPLLGLAAKTRRW